jgi:hypothetical protein
MASHKLNDSRVASDFASILAIFSHSGKTGCRFINEDKRFQIQRWLFSPEGIMGCADIVPVSPVMLASAESTLVLAVCIFALSASCADLSLAYSIE